MMLTEWSGDLRTTALSLFCLFNKPVDNTSSWSSDVLKRKPMDVFSCPHPVILEQLSASLKSLTLHLPSLAI